MATLVARPQLGEGALERSGLRVAEPRQVERIGVSGHAATMPRRAPPG
jgi:hypothetical protein